MPTAAYDEIADWYEREFLAGQRAGGQPAADPLGVDRALRDLLGRGGGACLEIGCGTGVRAQRVRELGWTPVGVDLSAGMLRHARGRLPVARADAELLPIRDGFADRSVAEAVVIGPGYLDGHWTKASWTDQGVRARVGATHRPLPELLHAFLDAGLTLERFTEGGGPTPAVLGIRARKP